jgi:hypothetical protein
MDGAGLTIHCQQIYCQERRELGREREQEPREGQPIEATLFRCCCAGRRQRGQSLDDVHRRRRGLRITMAIDPAGTFSTWYFCCMETLSHRTGRAQARSKVFLETCTWERRMIALLREADCRYALCACPVPDILTPDHVGLTTLRHLTEAASRGCACVSAFRHRK